MDAIDQAPFNFSPTVGLVVAVMVGFLVFQVVSEPRKLRETIAETIAAASGTQ